MMAPPMFRCDHHHTRERHPELGLGRILVGLVPGPQEGHHVYKSFFWHRKMIVHGQMELPTSVFDACRHRTTFFESVRKSKLFVVTISAIAFCIGGRVRAIGNTQTVLFGSLQNSQNTYNTKIPATPSDTTDFSVDITNSGRGHLPFWSTSPCSF